jgi:hypothetical protein
MKWLSALDLHQWADSRRNARGQLLLPNFPSGAKALPRKSKGRDPPNAFRKWSNRL